MLNYLSELNAFQDWLETQPMVTNSQICLWYALMAIANRAGWPERFAVAISVLEDRTRLKRDAILSARNGLAQCGRIEFQTRQGRQSAVYRLLPFASVKTTQQPTHTPQDAFVSFRPTQEATQPPPQSPTQPPTQSQTSLKRNESIYPKEYIQCAWAREGGTDEWGNPLPDEGWLAVQRAYMDNVAPNFPQGVREEDLWAFYQAVGRDAFLVAIAYTARNAGDTPWRHNFLARVLGDFRARGVRTREAADARIREVAQQKQALSQQRARAAPCSPPAGPEPIEKVKECY